MQKKNEIAVITKSILFWMFIMNTLLISAQNEAHDNHLTSAMDSTELLKEKSTRFDQWLVSKKRHALVGYNGTIGQYGFNKDQQSSTLSNDMGAFYWGYLVKNNSYKLKAQAWVEYSGIWAGKNSKEFSKELGMFSAVNGSSHDAANYHSLNLEYLYLENFLFDDKLNLTVGKLDPTFLTTFLLYTGWDRLTYFGKTAASDPVPPIDPGFGFLGEYSFTSDIKLGAIISDANPNNELIDPVNFFSNTSYNYHAYLKFGFPNKQEHLSTHIFSYYYGQGKAEEANAKGFTYVGNQEVVKNWILTLKASHGTGRVDKYNGAYSAGFVKLKPFNRSGDQFGTALVVNEKSGKYEYGFDSYYKFFLKEWICVSANVQMYQSYNKQLNVVPGARVMITY